LFKDSDGKDGVTKAGDNPKLDKFNIDKAAEVKKLRKEAEPIYKYILAESGQARMDSLLHIRKSKAVDDGAYDYNINDPAVKEWLGDRLDEFSDEVTGTTFDEIKAVLREGWTEGKPLAAIETSLREKFAGFEQYRAQLIARTETIASANKADVDAVRQAGLDDKLLKSWLTSRDGAVRETHLKAEQDYAEGIPLEEDFKVGDDSMDSPGNGQLAEESCNCRCSVVYIEKGE
jgi:hypothetical protein